MTSKLDDVAVEMSGSKIVSPLTEESLIIWRMSFGNVKDLKEDTIFERERVSRVTMGLLSMLGLLCDQEYSRLG